MSSGARSLAFHWLLFLVNSCTVSKACALAAMRALWQPPAIDMWAPNKGMANSRWGFLFPPFLYAASTAKADAGMAAPTRADFSDRLAAGLRHIGQIDRFCFSGVSDEWH